MDFALHRSVGHNLNSQDGKGFHSQVHAHLGALLYGLKANRKNCGKLHQMSDRRNCLEGIQVKRMLILILIAVPVTLDL